MRLHSGVCFGTRPISILQVRLRLVCHIAWFWLQICSFLVIGRWRILWNSFLGYSTAGLWIVDAIVVKKTDLDWLCLLSWVVFRHVGMHHHNFVGEGNLGFLVRRLWSLLLRSHMVGLHLIIIWLGVASWQNSLLPHAVWVWVVYWLFILLTLHLSALISLGLACCILSWSITLELFVLAIFWCASIVCSTNLRLFVWIKIYGFLLDSPSVGLLLATVELVGISWRLTVEDVTKSLNTSFSLGIFVHLLSTIKFLFSIYINYKDYLISRLKMNINHELIKVWNKFIVFDWYQKLRNLYR